MQKEETLLFVVVVVQNILVRYRNNTIRRSSTTIDNDYRCHMADVQNATQSYDGIITINHFF